MFTYNTCAALGDIDNYTVVKILSSGESSTVDLVKDKTNGSIYVCKLQKIRPVLNINEMRNQFYKEINLLRNSSHTNIIRLIDFSDYSNFRENNKYCYSCMYYLNEYCSGGDLLEFVKQHPLGIGEAYAKQIFCQIVSGLNFLHSHGYAHGDIRLENLVLTNENTVKFIDFEYIKDLNTKSSDFRGSNYYMAPEILRNEEFYPGIADVFAAGCVLFALVLGCPAFSEATPSDCNYRLLNLKPQEFWRRSEARIKCNISLELKDLLMGMIQYNPEKRINLDGVKNHNWLRVEAKL
ncbi:hypothetical protein SteCoe_29523 [Stentor coeruleus]|uniref:Protein kinase domain-containing protein n=1 Tax=Stentor coeruleus TaxID=5963 RepID=A0A1R2B617_9CILI|nr:hypothetical protein SteCoe_29523 [Stentor coeruleus]